MIVAFVFASYYNRGKGIHTVDTFYFIVIWFFVRFFGFVYSSPIATLKMMCIPLIATDNDLLLVNELDVIRRYLPALERPKFSTRYSKFQVLPLTDISVYNYSDVLSHLWP